MNSKKILPLFLCLLILILSIIACSGGSYTTLKSIESDTDTSMKMSYSKFNGEKFKTLKLKSGDVLNFNVNTKTNGGNLSIGILYENGTELYYADTSKSPVSENITISKDGNYKIKVTAQNHSGDYDINWKIANSN
jgi:hypothetical protein